MRTFLAFVLTASTLSVALAGLSAQVPGTNVNMVTGTTFPGGDPWLQKQNEPSIAVSTRNPCTLLGGANDYRAVNVPGHPDDKEIGDAWLGLYKSTDCGQTWFSTLVPGYPQDQSPEGQASPVKGLAAGADPTIRSGPGGMFFYSFIAFNRGSNVGKYAVARFIDNNNIEGGDPIQYLGTTLIDSGSAGQFLDKPWIVVTKGAGTCSVNGVQIPASVVHMAWTVFVGNSEQTIRTKVYYARSSNCGASLDGPPTKLSEGYPINQGAAIAVSPVNGSVYVAWRQFATDKTNNAILVSRSTDGKMFTKAEPIPYLNGFQPFDQGTTSRSFRTNAFPTMAADHTGRVHLAIAARGYGSVLSQARIIYLNSTDGMTWSMPTVVDPGPYANPGHQVMPALTYAAGKLHLIWYDFHEDEAGRASPEAFFLDRFIQEIYPIRHTVDVRGAVGTLQENGQTSFTPYGILQVPTNHVPRSSRYLVGSYGGSAALKQLQYNMPNLKLYAGGTRPFMGDYIDIAGLSFLPVRTSSGQQWVLNDGLTPGGSAGVFHAVWADNRDAKVGSASAEPADETLEGAKVDYAAPGTPECNASTAAFTAARNANVYTSRITPGLFLAAPGNAKTSACSSCPGGRIQRAFGVFVQNTTGTLRTFRLTIANQPPNGVASFRQFPGSPLTLADTQVDVTVAPRSSAARTVYVTSDNENYPYVLVTALEQGAPAGETPLAAAAILNPDIQNPDIQNPDIQNQEIHNPDIQNPDIQNPDIQNPDIQNPDIQNPDIQNPDIQNPDIQNPDIQNPDIQNPDIQNPDIQNPDIQNGSLTDVSFDVTNEGNTTSTFQVAAEVGGDTSGYLFQLVGRRVYKTPAADGCTLTEAATNQILFNIVNPDITGAFFDGNDGDVRNATVLLEPGETIKVTLRAWDKDVRDGLPDDGVITPFCPMIGDLCTSLTHSLTLRVRAHAANNVAGVIDGAPATATAGATPLTITTDALPGAFVGLLYDETPQALGAAPFSWNLTAGALPAGLTLDEETGAITGTPENEGVSTFTLEVTDSAGGTATREFTVRTMSAVSGDLFVTDGGPGATSGSVFRLRPDESAPGTYVTELVASVNGRPQDIAAGPVQGLVIADSSNAAVLRVTPGHIETIYSGAPLVQPIAVAVDGAGNVLVGDNITDKVYRISVDGVVTELVTLPSSPSEAQDIQILIAGTTAIVSDDGGMTVTILSINMDVDPFAVETLVDESGIITRSGGIAVSGSTIYVADFSQNKIFAVDTAEGVTISEFLDVAGIGQNMTDLALDGGFIVPINFEAAIKKVVAGESGAVITTLKSGAPLTFPTAVLVIPSLRGVEMIAR